MGDGSDSSGHSCSGSSSGWRSRDTLRETGIYLRLLTRVLPLVERELRGWVNAARLIPDAELRSQALASLERKKFHCVGGSVLALMEPVNPANPANPALTPTNLHALVRAIVAIQTISDYLDNLCDRSSVAARLAASGDAMTDDAIPTPYPFLRGAPPQAAQAYSTYLRLHEAMLCAVDPERPVADYYSLYLRECPGSGTARAASHVDGGYLDRLVEASRLTLRDLPGYGAVKPFVSHLVTLYSELQAGKHLSPEARDRVMEGWFATRYLAQPTWPSQPSPTWLSQPPATWLGRDLHWWEFGAATGSTLAMFALLCASSDSSFDQSAARSLAATYFPSICALHILLDYYIDQAEDVAGGDLNFVAHYSSKAEAVDSLEGFVRWSSSAAASTRDSGLHRAVVRGLLAMYLSDPKVEAQGMREQALRLARAGQGLTAPLRSACALLRKALRF